jgi:hypothetical protein
MADRDPDQPARRRPGTPNLLSRQAFGLIARLQARGVIAP